MGKKLAISALVRGMGLGTRVLELLVNEAIAQGANEEVFAFMTRPRFKHNLERIGRTIANCNWRIPASEMRDRSLKFYKQVFAISNDTSEEREELLNLMWEGPCKDLGIPVESFYKDPSDGHIIPHSIFKYLDGKIMTYPLVVAEVFDRNDCCGIIVDWHTIGNAHFYPGDTIDMSKVDSLSIANEKYFDFNK